MLCIFFLTKITLTSIFLWKMTIIFNIFRRQGPDKARETVLKKTNTEGSKNPIFGKLDPMTILNLLMKNNPENFQSKLS